MAEDGEGGEGIEEGEHEGFSKEATGLTGW